MGAPNRASEAYQAEIRPLITRYFANLPHKWEFCHNSDMITTSIVDQGRVLAESRRATTLSHLRHTTHHRGSIMTTTELKTLWKGQRHHLDKMSLRELILAYLLYPAVRIYLSLLISSAALLAYLRPEAFPVLLSAVSTVLIYPLAWYLIHRFILHGRFLYRSSLTAALWKRIHYDHHRDPNDLRVLFGALYTTLPTIALVALPVGYLLGGAAGAVGAFAAGIASTLFYEFFHCIQHLRYVPRAPGLRRFKRLHMMHHFHNEQGNFGITNFLWDRILGTYYDQASELPSSETVFNLGYDGEEQARYPWVGRISDKGEHELSHSTSTS